MNTYQVFAQTEGADYALDSYVFHAKSWEQALDEMEKFLVWPGGRKFIIIQTSAGMKRTARLYKGNKKPVFELVT